MEKFFHETFLLFISLTVNAFVGASKMLKEQKDAHLSRAMTMYGDYLLCVCFTCTRLDSGRGFGTRHIR